MRDYPWEHIKIDFFWLALHVVACYKDNDGKLLNHVRDVILLTQNVAVAKRVKVVFFFYWKIANDH